MPGESYQGVLRPLSPQEHSLRRRLQGHVEELAGRIGERNMRHPDELHAAARYVEAQFRESGLKVSSETYEVHGMSVRNLVATVHGQTRPDEIVLIGAHYDSMIGTPGANDNASGVAALLAIAGSLAAAEVPQRTVRLVAFVNEEPPRFQTRNMGSRNELSHR